MTAERQKLRDFLETHIPFVELKKVGFWPKGTRKTDYEVIANRVCERLGLSNIYDYDIFGEEIEVPDANVVIGKFKDRIDENGYNPGGGYILHVCQSSFMCPICECPQPVKDSPHGYHSQKCKGCKRTLKIAHCQDGSLQVFEK
jgi:hypothetical protein